MQRNEKNNDHEVKEQSLCIILKQNKWGIPVSFFPNLLDPPMTYKDSPN